MRTFLCFDIETAPADDFDELREPFTPTEFDPKDVKTGNMTDPEKIQKKIRDAEKAHAEAQIEDQRKHDAEQIKKALKDAYMGKVLSIGIRTQDGYEAWTQPSEQFLLTAFCAIVRETINQGGKVFGYYSTFFDLPFMYHRCLKHDILHMDYIATDQRGYYEPHFVDYKTLWEQANRSRDRIGLKKLAKHMGLPVSWDGEVTGATYWQAFQAGGADREAALRYLQADVDAVYHIALRRGDIEGGEDAS